MRIVLSNASSSWGGVHTITAALATGLQARGHEVVVLCRPGTMIAERMRGLAPVETVLGATDFNPVTVARVAAVLRRVRADVAVALMKKDVRVTGPAAWLSGVPFVVRSPNEAPLKRGLRYRLLYGALPALHIANSEATRRILLGSAPYLRPDEITVVHNGVDADEIAAAPRIDLGTPPGAVVFGFIARFDEWKGPLDLAAAWPAVAAALPGAYLALAGTGAQEERVRAMLAEAPRVLWPGYQKNAPGFMKAVDVTVMPSHSEGFGMVAIESLAAGTPLIVTRAGALPEIVRHGVEGLIVEPRDPAGLADAMIRLGRDAGLRARMAGNGVRRVREDFSVRAMVDRYEALLQSVARGG